MNYDENMSTTVFPLGNDYASSTFACTLHANNISKKLQTFYEQEDYLDIVLVADNDKTSVSAHRIVLSASSDFFHAMFCSSLKEARATEVTIKDIDGATLRTILNFMYTGCIELRIETIEKILTAADFFQMNTLVEACCKFMQKRLDATNCLGIASFAEQHSYTELNKDAIAFALQNYEKVSNGNDFFQLSEDQICKLISSDDLYVQSEETVFLSVVAWVRYDKTNREKSIFKILSLVRFISLESKFLEFIVKSRHSVCKTIECYELMCDWLQWHHLSPEKRKLQLTNLKYSLPRNNAGGKIAFISGKYSNLLTLQTLDPGSMTWSYTKIPQLNVSKEHYRITYIKQKLIITGGEIDSRKTNSVECLNLLTNEWSNLCPMGSARSRHVATVAEGHLYVVGGSGGRNSVEKYDFSTNRWQYLESLPISFGLQILTALCGHLYAFNDLHEVWCYDCTNNKWIQKKDRKRTLYGFGCAAVCGKLYTVGGCDFDGNDSKTLQCYNSNIDEWEKKQPLHLARSYVYCTALHDRLIVAGGRNSEFPDLVEEYDTKKNRWTGLPPLLDYFPIVNYNLLFTM